MADGPKPLTDAQKQLLDTVATADPTGNALEIAKSLVKSGNLPLNSPNLVAAGRTEEQWSKDNRGAVSDATLKMLSDRVVGALDEQLVVADGGNLGNAQLKAFTALGVTRAEIGVEGDAIDKSTPGANKTVGPHTAMLNDIANKLKPLATGGDIDSYTPPPPTPVQQPASGTFTPGK